MPEITLLQSDQINEAKRMIYTVAFQLFRETATLDEAIARYEQTWPLRDIDNFQQHYLGNGGIYLVMVEDSCIIGSGAIRRIEEKVCEVKRLWFLPEYQGKGLGYQMMTMLLDFAREKGYEKVRLATSPAYQPRAYAFYHQVGFYDIPRYNDDPDDIGMELAL